MRRSRAGFPGSSAPELSRKVSHQKHLLGTMKPVPLRSLLLGEFLHLLDDHANQRAVVAEPAVESREYSRDRGRPRRRRRRLYQRDPRRDP